MTPARLSAPPRFALAEREGARVTLRAGNGAVAHVFVLEDDVMRLLLLADGTVTSPPSWAIAPGQSDIAEPGRDRMASDGFACPDYTVDEAGGRLTIASERLRLEVKLEGLFCTWFQRGAEGWREIEADRPTQAYNFGWWDDATYHYLCRRPGERIYGLGERTGAMDRSGRRFRLTNLDPMGYDAEHADPLYKTIPWLLVTAPESGAHGLFYDITADLAFDFSVEHDNYHLPYRYLRAERGDLDLYVIAGPDAGEVVRRFTWLTGRPALMPRWALGYSGSTMSYTDAPDAQAQMAKFIDGLQTHDIGCSSFHLSSGYTSIGDKRYVFHWNRDKFPDVDGFVGSYREAGVRLVANIKPALLHDHPRYGELAEAGLLVHDADGAPVECQFWDEVGSYVDFTNPAAAAWWRGEVTRQLLAHGIAATWNDNNEYEIWDKRALVHGFGHARPAADMRSIQTLLMMRASRAAQAAFAPGERPYVVTRSGMAGMQRYAQTWSGDNYTAWKTLRFNQKMALGLALSGVSNTGHDVGGFWGPAPGPELLLRWIQAGIVMPRFSIHSWNSDGTVNEPWMYPEATAQVAWLLCLRQQLAPLLYDLLWRHHADYEPVTRPLWLDHPGDAKAWEDGDSFMLGPDLLVAPVMEQGKDALEVYLPEGAEWFDLRDDRSYPGGASCRVAAPLDALPPMFARAGSGVFVCLTEGGFGQDAGRQAVLLYPPAGAGRLVWQGFDDGGDGFPGDGPAPCWRIEVEAGVDRLDVVRSWQGDGPPPGEPPALLLPLAEARAVRLNGEVFGATRASVLGGERQLLG